MIQVDFTPQCQTLLDQSGLTSDLAAAAVNARQRTITDSHGKRLIACFRDWDDQIILVDAEVPGECSAGTPGRVRAVVAQVALSLQPELPAGLIGPEADAETILAMAAESFGYPLTCDSDEPVSTLYTGPGTRETVVVHSGCIPREFWLVGSFHPAESLAEMVWAFRPECYRQWLLATPS